MKQKLLVCVLCFVGLFFFQERVHAYSLQVHKKITEKTIDQNAEKLNKYINDYTGLTKGVDEFIDTKKIRKWIEDGSWKEDFNWSLLNNPLFSHFYNPLTNRSGVGDIWPSAYDWANASNNIWSWKMAGDNFYKGLTLTTKTERDKVLAKAFEGIGHVMHLIQDVAVPAHVRDNLHISEPYESYTNKNIANLQYTLISFPFWNISISPYAPKQFWDLDSYNRSIPYGSGYIGLSEYTNANFASSDTIFSETLLSFSPLYFPFPRKSSSILYEEINPLTNKKTKYFKIIKESENIDHFAVAERFYDIYEGFPNWQRFFISLDDRCHNDYQQKLIRRAVGYSAGLLNYFFRGEMDIVPDEETRSGYVIVNNTDEDMSGTFELWYDNKNDERAKLQSWALNISKKSSGNNKSTNINFTPLTDAKEPGKYILVFRGKLGNEEDAVAGRIVELKGGEYLFLVSAYDHSVAAFKIKTTNNQYQLEPVTQNINFTVWGSPSSLLTVQSNPDQNEHKVALPWSYYRGVTKFTTYTPNIAKYGGKVYYFTDWLGYDYYFTIGFPQAYIPKNFNDDRSPYVWDSDFTYGEWLYKKEGYYTYRRMGSYIHGRRPFSIVNNKLVEKNINIRENAAYTYSGNDYSGPFHIQYKDESGNWVRGVDLTLEENETPLAVISLNKIISMRSKEGGMKIKFGDFVLHTTPPSTEYNNFACGECKLGCGIELYGEERNYPELYGYPLLCSGSGGWGSTSFNIIPNDYDNMNGDDTFIMFFAEEKYSRDEAYFEEVFRDGAGCCAVRFTGTFGQISLTDTFYLTYQTNSSAIEKITLAEAVLINDYHDQQLWVSGVRITGMSSQINDKNIVYTYIKQKPNNNNPCGGWDCPNMWEPNKRVIGIINISDEKLPVGYREEFEITEANTSGFLTDIYKDFNYKDLAAIGVHAD